MKKKQYYYIKYIFKKYILEKNEKLSVKCISNRNHKQVYAINNKYILKHASKNIIMAEFLFFNSYHGTMYENIIWYKGGNDIIYNYIDIESENILGSDSKIYLEEVYKLVKTYKTIKKNGYGKIFSLKNKWTDFLNDEVENRYVDMNKKHKEKIVIAKEQIKILENYEFDKKLLHGDLGFYNIMFNKGKIHGIIDPICVLGDPLYDFIYFALSKPNFLKKGYLNEIINITDEPVEKVKALMYIVLYIRISIEEHFNDERNLVKTYEEIWNAI